VKVPELLVSNSNAKFRHGHFCHKFSVR